LKLLIRLYEFRMHAQDVDLAEVSQEVKWIKK
jgi:hypothetical protein